MKNNFYKVFIILLFLFLVKIENSAKIHYIKPNIKISNIEDTMTLTKPNLEYVVYKIFKDTITSKIDSINAEYTIKQIYLESGHLKSSLCIDNNNLTGMKHPRVRETTSFGRKNGYAHYESWIESVKDLYLWRKARNLIGANKEELLNSLERTYAEDPNYTKKLVRVSTLKDF
jgi:uncharacterized FlgJ-related protein